MSEHDLGDALHDLLADELVNNQTAPGALLRVEAPDFTWAGGAGFCDPNRGLAIAADDAFEAASITKMLTATVCLTLAEDGLLDLDCGIGRYLPHRLTDELHVVDGVSYGPALTLRQVLGHRSGLADFFGDGPLDAEGMSPFLAEITANPDRFWSPLEVINWTKAHLTARFPPGTGWHYSDTGYVLAGLVIEAVTGEPLHDVFRLWVLAPLGMDHSYLRYRETPRLTAPGRPPCRPFHGRLDYGRLKGSSADWACGGLVTTTADLARFLRAFVEGRLLQRPESRAQMLDWQETGEPGVGYGLGVRHFDLAKLGLSGFGSLWGHTGFLKAFMLYWPEGEVILCGTMNQSQATGVFSEFRPVSTLVPAVLQLLRTNTGPGQKMMPSTSGADW